MGRLGAGARAQGSRERVIGVLSPISEDAAFRNVEALREGLRDLGYFEGRNVKLEIRYAGGATDESLNLPPSW